MKTCPIKSIVAGEFKKLFIKISKFLFQFQSCFWCCSTLHQIYSNTVNLILLVTQMFTHTPIKITCFTNLQELKFVTFKTFNNISAIVCVVWNPRMKIILALNVVCVIIDFSSPLNFLCNFLNCAGNSCGHVSSAISNQPKQTLDNIRYIMCNTAPLSPHLFIIIKKDTVLFFGYTILVSTILYYMNFSKEVTKIFLKPCKFSATNRLIILFRTVHSSPRDNTNGVTRTLELVKCILEHGHFLAQWLSYFVGRYIFVLNVIKPTIDTIEVCNRAVHIKVNRRHDCFLSFGFLYSYYTQPPKGNKRNFKIHKISTTRVRHKMWSFCGELLNSLT